LFIGGGALVLRAASPNLTRGPLSQSSNWRNARCTFAFIHSANVCTSDGGASSCVISSKPLDVHRFHEYVLRLLNWPRQVFPSNQALNLRAVLLERFNARSIVETIGT
jgi:hypothetical protein